MLRACKEFCVFDSFKYFHTADTFAALVRATFWSCHIIVWYNLFGLLAYLATILVAEHSVHSYYFCYLNVWNRNNDVWLKDCVALSGPAAAWMQIWMSLTPVSHRKRQWSMSSTCFIATHISEWQRSHRKHDDGWPSDSSTWVATKRVSHAPLILLMWDSRNRHSWIVVIQEKYCVGVWNKIAIF